MRGSSNVIQSVNAGTEMETRLNSSPPGFYWIAIQAAVQGSSLVFKPGDFAFMGLGASRLIDRETHVFISKIEATSPLSLHAGAMIVRPALG
jgi:hypothetical protein